MEAIILAGGFGTRLRHVVTDVPKPMAPMDDNGTPFLNVLLDKLMAAGFTRVILSTGYMRDKIRAYYGLKYGKLDVSYSEEETPLFTGGAIKKALRQCAKDSVFVLNGDTCFDVDFSQMRLLFQTSEADVVMAIKWMDDCSRYGTVERNGGRIVSFHEKLAQTKGWINGGCYCLKRELLEPEAEKFSFEKYMEDNIDKKKIVGYESGGFFIDIGVPEDYYMARELYGIKPSGSV
jgi:putative D-glycero-D-manno-heptose 1-phosphate guanosyltransferase